MEALLGLRVQERSNYVTFYTQNISGQFYTPHRSWQPLGHLDDAHVVFCFIRDGLRLIRCLHQPSLLRLRLRPHQRVVIVHQQARVLLQHGPRQPLRHLDDDPVVPLVPGVLETGPHRLGAEDPRRRT